MENTRDLLPLTEAFYYILVSLYASPSHGYGMMQDVERLSGGRVKIGAGTLYTALNNLMKKGLIIPSDGVEADSRRKTYAITPFGKQVVMAEMERLEELLRNGRKVTQL
ncbi:PadR family transcriptional regulator [Paenibacillus methanolicus]|uniref:PadR family transcriptional regulator n=1 Tax=Paenibacillus methanolicus TaxID=582686 RepID=A0A5S5CKA3_9BACL|nr:PadR family transcriptional regulator [Paenibacillus methanolicus]TYP79423.1 PadR family transcriptional regulator [Paenibacillus methanolicus]